jgi:hypothetical protein
LQSRIGQKEGAEEPHRSSPYHQYFRPLVAHEVSFVEVWR